jgi:hypothetical protein
MTEADQALQFLTVGAIIVRWKIKVKALKSKSMNNNFVPFTVEDYLPKPESSSSYKTTIVILWIGTFTVYTISIYCLWKANDELNKLHAELEKQRKLNANLPS